MATASRLMQFFNLLPKLPGKHAAPMLSLAVEAIAESGLWRRGVLLPQLVGGKARWLRGFSWPQLFRFAHERLPQEMRFRLWKCSLQLCVSDPELAPFAEVPWALASIVKEAPPGAADLLREAVALGADSAALSPLLARIPPEQRDAPPPEGVPRHLLARDQAQKVERECRACLQEQGVDIASWAPADVQAAGHAAPAPPGEDAEGRRRAEEARQRAHRASIDVVRHGGRASNAAAAAAGAAAAAARAAAGCQAAQVHREDQGRGSQPPPVRRGGLRSFAARVGPLSKRRAA
eukprot:CAMPEP_0198518774 /NCGR_PEP_ID=MMETSP1462-20131121/19315_1 /TAXON_ID=1333877 /ORGANISM="Brandtodinium nutriculum, Strain RCC3387" /LENGTH=291 /DNA_ID=CAMNT_0044248371 /DNA_START=1 /DNA_END=872 /DNA_ORIENTATION=+